MGDVPACLDGKAKPLRSDLTPAEKHLRSGQSVKRVVQLNRGKATCIVGELLPLFELGGVENAFPPVAIDVSRGADPYLCPTGHVPIYRCSRASSGVKLRALSLRGQNSRGESHHCPKTRGVTAFEGWMPQAGLAATYVGLGQDDFYIYSEGQMKTVLTALALVAGIAACNKGGTDSARVGESADTMVTPRTTQDTTIVTSDTTVRADTTVKEGDVKRSGTGRDTTNR